jgi:hypothetical protein
MCRKTYYIISSIRTIFRIHPSKFNPRFIYLGRVLLFIFVTSNQMLTNLLPKKKNANKSDDMISKIIAVMLMEFIQ